LKRFRKRFRSGSDRVQEWFKGSEKGSKVQEFQGFKGSRGSRVPEVQAWFRGSVNRL
jgi:hypothetical protein